LAKLANAIESQLIPRPTTWSNWSREVDRFDQYYQNFCGFENIKSAQLYLAIFEKLYCFTPLSDDAQPVIRGKYPSL